MLILLVKRESSRITNTYDQLRTNTPIKAKEPFIPPHLLNAIKAVLVQQLPDNVTPLVLHPSLVGHWNKQMFHTNAFTTIP